MKSLTFLYVLLIASVLVLSKSIDTTSLSKSNLFKRYEGTCDPKDFTIDNNYKVFHIDFNRKEMNHKFDIYDCKVYNSNTVVACMVNIPVGYDDFVAFKVKQAKTHKCTADFCQDPHKDSETYIYDNNNKPTEMAAIGNHFCHRYTDKDGNNCDVNYYIQDIEYKENWTFWGDLASWASGAAFSKFNSKN